MTMTALSNWSWFGYPDRPNIASEKMACTTPRSFMNLSNLKRKRSGSVDLASRESGKPPMKILRAMPDSQATAASQETSVHRVSADSHVAADLTEAYEHGGNKSPPKTAPGSANSSQGNPHPRKPLTRSKMDPEQRNRVRERMVAQIDLEILLKHDEHRLIEQELAKCQVALEQIRRCSLIPFPVERLAPQNLDQVSTGTGPALDPGPRVPKPPQAAPWGVTDGPYTQHYARWLIPDPQFDVTTPGPANPADSRPLRQGTQDRGQHGASRSQRAFLDQRLTSIPGSNSQSKEKAQNGPLLCTKSDGTIVKLVCNRCGKDDAHSIQGFLNHCRIAHQLTFAKHTHAADECGVPLDENEAAVQTPHDSLTARPVGTPLVHSFNQSSANPSRLQAAMRSSHEAGHSQQSSPATVQPAPKRRRLVQASSSKPLSGPPVNMPPNPSFVPSNEAPKLSALLQRSGFGGDLNQMVESAKERCSIDDVESLHGEDEAEESPVPERQSHGDGPPATTASGSMGPAVSIMRVPAGQSTSSSRNMIPNSQSSSFEHAVLTSPLNDHNDSATPNSIPHDHGAADLSPSATSTNPGLVTDCEDDAEEDAPSEYEKVLRNEQHHVAVKGDADGDSDMADVSAHAKGVSKKQQHF